MLFYKDFHHIRTSVLRRGHDDCVGSRQRVVPSLHHSGRYADLDLEVVRSETG